MHPERQSRPRWTAFGLALAALGVVALAGHLAAAIELPDAVVAAALAVAAAGLALWVVDAWRTSRAQDLGLLRSLGRTLRAGARYLWELVTT